MRLDKYLSKAAGLSRSEAKNAVRKKRAAINGVPAARPEQKVGADDRVTLDGQPLAYEEHRYFMMHKPAGVLSAAVDAREETVVDLLGEAGDFFPVGRLDKDTTGLLLLTDDGALAHRLLSPRHHVDKCYLARLDGAVGEEEKARLTAGVDIGDEKPTLPARLYRREEWASLAEEEILGQAAALAAEEVPAREDAVLLVIREGRYHQVKRMFQAVGRKVLSLKRLSMGSLVLDAALRPGESRRLTEEEMSALGLGRTERKQEE